MEEKKEIIVIAPKSGTDITKGKEYKTIRCSELGFTIKDDSGYTLYCLKNRCAHLSGGNWIIKD